MIEIIRGLVNIKPGHKHAVVTIGNFDGVHKGHQALLRRVRQAAADQGVKSMLICFEPQPREFFDEYQAPARLTRFREKVALLDDQGIDQVLCVKFNLATRTLSTQAFIDILVKQLAVTALYVGDDFKFGNNRQGSFSDLQVAGQAHGFPVTNLYTLVHDDLRISSTRIRECLAAGEFDLAAQMLGHPWSITGKIFHGRQLGRTLDVPTANIQLHRYVAPVAGVFAVQMAIDDQVHQGVANVGVRPTVEGSEQTRPILEVHLFDFAEDIYGKTVKVIFRHKIRDEKKFDDLDELKQAIFRDIDEARAYFQLGAEKESPARGGNETQQERPI